MVGCAVGSSSTPLARRPSWVKVTIDCSLSLLSHFAIPLFLRSMYVCLISLRWKEWQTRRGMHPSSGPLSSTSSLALSYVWQLEHN